MLRVIDRPGRDREQLVLGEVTVDADFPDNGGKNPAPAEGIIAFQIHAGYPKMQVEFKDIKFTDLSKK